MTVKLRLGALARHAIHNNTPLDAPFTLKTHDEELFIRQALLANSLFTGIPADSFQRLVDACERKSALRGEIVIAQGDSCKGGNVYLIAEGRCRVLVDDLTCPEPYGIIAESIIRRDGNFI